MKKGTWILDKDRPKTALTIEVPVDVLEDLKQMAETRDMKGVHGLIRYYIGKGMKEDMNQHRMTERTDRPKADSTQLEAIP